MDGLIKTPINEDSSCLARNLLVLVVAVDAVAVLVVDVVAVAAAAATSAANKNGPPLLIHPHLSRSRLKNYATYVLRLVTRVVMLYMHMIPARIRQSTNDKCEIQKS